ncbi:MAG: cytochrome c, partial [Bacteroidota bacterium]
VPEDYRDKFKAIHIAEATDPDTRDESFEAMSEAFLKRMDQLYEKQQSGDQELIKGGYNLMVQACMNCHASYCPGPMVRIKKLYIAEK